MSQENFSSLHSKWLESGRNKWLKPSVDRLNNNKGYYIGNIELVTWRVNFDRSKRDISLGKLNNGCGTKIKIHSCKNGSIVNYDSIRHASRSTGKSIKNIRDKIKTGKNDKNGCLWKIDL